MNRDEEQFVQALRRMAAAAPQDAPAELGLKLRDAFLDHRRRRRRAHLLKMSALAACLVGVAGWTWLTTVGPRSKQTLRPVPQQVERTPVSAPPSGTGQATRPSPSEKTVLTIPPSKPAPARRNARLENAPDTNRPTMGDFMVLPSFDPAIPVERSQIVRVELPGQSLNLFGIPVGNEMLDRRVIADVAVAQDGRPYAVRFVQGYK